jgi:beta-mannosidase
LANKKIPDPFESGDTHDWSVSHGRVPFTEYEKHHLRFVSEYDQGAVAGHLAE